MNLDLAGKIALVTGSSKGIGKSIAKTLLEEGCKVMLNGRNRSILEIAHKDLGENSSYCVADVTSPIECELLINTVIEKWGKLDILICNVGNGTSVKPGEENPEEWKRIFNLNLTSVTNMIQVATPELAKTHGSIVCISSIAGMEVTNAPVTYSVAKSALNAYVRGISRPLANYEIRINAVAPGNILFKGSIWEKKLSEDPSLVKKILENEVALHRLGNPEEIANVVVFLSSSKAAFVTGGMYVVDGGQVRS